MNVPMAIFWGLMIAGLRSRGPLMLYIVFGAMAFETTAVAPPALIGGVTLTPGWMAMAILVVKLVMMQPRLSQALAPLADLRRIGLLTVCTVYGVVAAVFFPRLFEGQVNVFAMRVDVPGAVPLQPTPANVTQSFYFVMGTLGVLSFYLAARRPDTRRHLLNAILFGGGVCVFTGVLDMATSAAGVGQALAPFRTATYAYLVGAEVVGTRRVVGLCSEASTYADLCMSFAGPAFFLRNAFQRPLTRNVLAPLVFALLVVMIALSTSSAGYIGLGVLCGVILIFGVKQSLGGRSPGRQSLILVYAAATALFAIVVFRAEMLSRATELIDAMVFNKAMSSSYIERSAWNATTFQAFLGTFGLGAGLGSARASSWAIAILGDIGVIGAALMLAFLALSLLSRPPRGRILDRDLASGAKAALIPMLVMASLAGTSVGFSIMTACMFGIIGAVSWVSHQAPAPGRAHMGRRSFGGNAVRPRVRPV